MISRDTYPNRLFMSFRFWFPFAFFAHFPSRFFSVDVTFRTFAAICQIDERAILAATDRLYEGLLNLTRLGVC